MTSIDNHQPRKRFGQNFLTDQSIIEQIVYHFHPKQGENIVEIGPGLGAITIPLLKAAEKMQAVELDRSLIPKIAAQCETIGDITIHQGDALKFDFTALGTTPIRLIGNLPYNISTPLIFHLIKQISSIHDMHFMLQKEMVDRICAQPGNKDYGRLSVMIQYHCTTQKLFTIPPSAFSPPPKVQSALVRLTPHKKIPHPAQDHEQLAEVVRIAFNQRRKTLRNSLKTLLDNTQFNNLEIDSNKRPEQLSVSDFVRLANAISTRA